jgi:hypothetical protein
VPVAAVADDPPTVRWDDAAADGPDWPAALTTIMVAMAATTTSTGTRAARTGWRERNPACCGPAVDDARALEVGREADWFFVAGRADRDRPVGVFDMMFSLLGPRWREGAHARRLDAEAPYALRGTAAGTRHARIEGVPARARRRSS